MSRGCHSTRRSAATSRLRLDGALRAVTFSRSVDSMPMTSPGTGAGDYPVERAPQLGSLGDADAATSEEGRGRTHVETL